MTTNLNDLAKQIHENAKAKGFWDEPRNTGEIFMLMVSELAEALEAHRKGRTFNKGVDWWLRRVGFNGDAGSFVPMFESDVKDTFEDEMADSVIRVLDWCHFSGLSINVSEYEQHEDFDLHENANTGEVLLEMTKWVVRAREEVGISQEACLNAVVILANNLSLLHGFDLLQHIELKMKYNATREHKHGKKY